MDPLLTMKQASPLGFEAGGHAVRDLGAVWSEFSEGVSHVSGSTFFNHGFSTTLKA